MSEPVTFGAATPRHDLPFLFAGQAQKEFFVNEALTRIDMLLQPVVLGIADTPPANPLAGQCWLVGTSPEGEWAEHADALASWVEGWRFTPAQEGMRVHDLGRSVSLVYRGGWRFPSPISHPAGGAVVDAEARAAIVALLQALREIMVLPSPTAEPGS